MRAILAMMVALPSIAPASTLTIAHQSIPFDLKQRSKLIASTLDANVNQTGFEIVHQSIPVNLEPRSRLNTQSCDKKCDMTFKPVCDSYGETHGNKCAFEIAACKAKKKKLTIVEEGVCGGCSKYEYKRKRIPCRGSALAPTCARNFEDSRAHCKSIGMDLIMEKTPKIHDELKFYKWHTFWMGIVRDPQQPGRFVFIDKTPVEKAYWNPGEPNNTKQDANCVYHRMKYDRDHLSGHKLGRFWNVDRCSEKKLHIMCQRCSDHVCENGDVCANGGNCIKLFDQFRCSCKAGFTGQRCEVNIDDCVSKPCLFGGTCIDEINSYSCQCPPDRAGKSCEHELTWSDDLRCGKKALFKGKKAECNPDGLACCSSSGQCGNGHCSCGNCINYKRVPCSGKSGKWLTTHHSTLGKKLKIQGGKTQKAKSCSSSSAVRGYRVKLDNKDEDSEGLTELNLYCIAKQNPAGKSTRTMIRSNGHYDGSFSKVVWCPKDEFVVGFRQQLYQGAAELGVTDVQILCADPKAKTGNTTRSSMGIRYVNGAIRKLSHSKRPSSPGIWTREVTCDPCQVVCGVRTRADLTNWWFYDDAGVTDIILKCCPF